ATAPKLRRIGIETIGDLANYDVKYLNPTFKSFSNVLWNYANGIDDSTVAIHHGAAKSVGNSTTTPFDVTTFDDANRVLLNLCESVGRNLRRNNYAASVISIGIRDNNFEHYSRQKKIGIPTDSTTEIYRYAAQIFKEGWRREPIRQLGVRAEKLSDSRIHQMTLDGEEREKQKILDRSIDKIRMRFGDDSVMRASFLCKNEKNEHNLDRFSPFRATGGL
ncbi:MAG: DNA polymerase IV, partial [Clostridiales bacterium]|nr:DNA polymerase IV [Clostridiales bacterium]